MQMKVQDIFRIERNGEFDRFSKSPYAKLTSGDRRLLWHGSRSTNFGGILSQGLRIAPPEAPVSGYMFGKGVYLADISSKSANYCVPSASGNVGLLLLCEAELGKPVYEPDGADLYAPEKAREEGCYSTWGKGMIVPKGWKDAGCVHENLKGVSMVSALAPLLVMSYPLALAFLIPGFLVHIGPSHISSFLAISLYSVALNPLFLAFIIFSCTSFLQPSSYSQS